MTSRSFSAPQRHLMVYVGWLGSCPRDYASGGHGFLWAWRFLAGYIAMMKFYEGALMQLFHYTDAAAVQSILTNGKMWLTDLRFLNDSEEMNHGLEHILEELKNPSATARISPEYVEAASSFIGDNLSFDFGDFSASPQIFVCSFSQSGDLLSQWRAYGSYAIEFDGELISSNKSGCLYDSKEKKSRAFTSVVDTLREVGRSHRANPHGMGEDGMAAYAELIKTAATFKHQSFEEEREVRMIRGVDFDDSFEVKFRPRGNILIPYIEVEVPFESIKAVHIGPMPNQEVAYWSMSSFVGHVDFNWHNANPKGNHAIDVKCSKTPYRAAL
ncbi:DUF2971 domain-containing protein [Pseudomonas sp. PDM09]|uniref:DUF2971 domain-containing protein n=1 Tax=Pseudomonas sp. PDM09 TaxID=2769270 RepID=UPI00177FF2A0|nr:DUF2971 domain-containing protein [Pseudomonas sp. PDM09]MBD9562967.1 DUF2971 domain-containing protein [Pseudomonas sp. PDM09]